MEETLYFILGAAAVLTIIGVAMVLRMAMQIKDLRSNVKNIIRSLDDISKEMEDRCKALDIRIDQEIDRTNKAYEDCLKYTDSRTDKLESRIESKFNDNTGFVDKLFHQITDLRKNKIK